MSSPALLQLLRIKAEFGPRATRTKLRLLKSLGRAALGSARQVFELHEALCFLRAYPDDPAVLAEVRQLLGVFAQRRDLQRFADRLRDTGIDGTAIHYRFYWAMVRWLLDRHPEQLHLDRRALEDPERLAAGLRLVLPLDLRPISGLAEDELWRTLDRLRGQETDATHLARRIRASFGSEVERESFHDQLDSPYVLRPSKDTPNRTRAELPARRVHFQRGAALAHQRPALDVEMRRAPGAPRPLSRAKGRQVIDRCCEAMVTRARDLEVFEYGNPSDVWWIDDERGLAFAFVGVEPERRLFPRAGYGCLLLRNGAPVGYLQVDSFGQNAEISFNIFPAFRGGEAAYLFARSMAAVRTFFGAETLLVEPYQLGQGNEEGLASGAFWFYQKLGFRPLKTSVRRVLATELAKISRDASYRSPRSTLLKLVEGHLYYSVSSAPETFVFDLSAQALRLQEVLQARAGSDYRAGQALLARDAQQRLRLRSWGTQTAAEEAAVLRFSPALARIPRLERWSSADAKGLAAVVRSKGAASERSYVAALLDHPRAARALVQALTA